MSEILVIIRPSFMKFCEDGCRSALFNHILYWIAKKAKGQPQDKIQAGEITWYATTDELTEQMASAWGSEKVRIEVNNLVKMGLIGRGKNPKFGADRTKHFYFGKEQCEKLLELCQKHEICLACLGLDDVIVHLMKTVKQICNSRNANPESVICFVCPKHEHFWNSGFANPESVEAITKISTKTVKPKISNERENDEPAQNPSVSAQEGSFSHSPTLSSYSEISFSPEEEAIYQLASKKHISLLKRDANHKAYCAKLASEEVTTPEKLESLMQHCWRKLKHKGNVELYLKNLITELDGWLQVQNAPQVPPSPSRNQQPTYVIDQEANERRKAALRALAAN